MTRAARHGGEAPPNPPLKGGGGESRPGDVGRELSSSVFLSLRSASSPAIKAVSAFAYRSLMAAALMLLLLAAGCEQGALVRGRVVDVKGEGVPGVAVTVRGTERQATTNADGRYALRCALGTVTLDLIKTGYTQGVLQIEARQAGALDVREAQLWLLPSAKGVHVFQDYRYQETTRTEPKRYVEKERGPVFAVKRDPDLALRQSFGGPELVPGAPALIAYKMQPYDARLYRLHQVEAHLPAQRAALAPPRADAPETSPQAKIPPSAAETVWTAADNIPIIAAPIDEPERLLLELRPAILLPPGTYAVHWGALDGHTSTDPGVFLFRIADPEEEMEEDADDAPEETAEQSEKKASPKPSDDNIPDAEAMTPDTAQE